MRRLLTHISEYRLIPVSITVFATALLLFGCSEKSYSAYELDRAVGEMTESYNALVEDPAWLDEGDPNLLCSWVRAAVREGEDRVTVFMFEDTKEKRRAVSEWVTDPEILVFEEFPELVLTGTVVEMDPQDQRPSPPDDKRLQRQRIVVRVSGGNYKDEVHEYAVGNIYNFMMPETLGVGDAVTLWVTDMSTGTAYMGNNATLLTVLKIEISTDIQ